MNGLLQLATLANNGRASSADEPLALAPSSIASCKVWGLLVVLVDPRKEGACCMSFLT